VIADGSLRDVMGERSLATVKVSLIRANLEMTFSIVGRFDGSIAVIASTRSFMNPKPLYL